MIDRGRPVPGLRIEDFELRDNGVIQRIRSVTREEVPLDAVLILIGATASPVSRYNTCAKPRARSPRTSRRRITHRS